MIIAIIHLATGEVLDHFETNQQLFQSIGHEYTKEDFQESLACINASEVEKYEKLLKYFDKYNSKEKLMFMNLNMNLKLFILSRMQIAEVVDDTFTEVSEELCIEKK